jgi:hypothetical protein
MYGSAHWCIRHTCSFHSGLLTAYTPLLTCRDRLQTTNTVAGQERSLARCAESAWIRSFVDE